MKIHHIIPLLLLAGGIAVNAQTNQAAADSKPASSNISGQQYPQIDSELRATFHVRAPDAKNVRVRIADTFYDMTKGEDGVWAVTTPPLVVGFHYYWLVIDGVTVTDPQSETFFGYGKMSGGLEVPSKGEDFYDVRKVSHGEAREHWYLSKTTAAWRRIFVYTPPDYDQNPKARSPVLYLQHGSGEDERSWVVQGRANLIMDNLIAEKKAKLMIVVMEKGYARPGEQPPPSRSNFVGALDDVF